MRWLQNRIVSEAAMPITLSCSCGKTLRVADEYAGRRVKCPSCNAIAPAPEPEPVFEVVATAPRVQAAPRPTPSAAKPHADEDEEYDGTTYGLSGGSSSENRDQVEDTPRDKPLPDFRLSSGQRGKKPRKNK
jgi:hypothetical protein